MPTSLGRQASAARFSEAAAAAGRAGANRVPTSKCNKSTISAVQLLVVLNPDTDSLQALSIPRQFVDANNNIYV